ncbi:hypothetical protein AAG570_007991 [Ranatra chinensis]|uniref:Uncharacterized protein n=1 Tax=Ranatra chinensis TaxID=642074 RepID=A0ABD0XTF6_9HEMI
MNSQPGCVGERERSLKSALHYCCESGEAGARCAAALVSVAPHLVPLKDQDGYTALHLAVIAGNLPLIRLLISKGAHIDAVDNEGHTSVHWATGKYIFHFLYTSRLFCFLLSRKMDGLSTPRFRHQSPPAATAPRL